MTIHPRAALAEPITATDGPLTPVAGGRTVGSNPATGATLLPLGLHFGLDADLYHADPGLGSTDLRLSAKNPFNYWFKSRMNPMRVVDDGETESKILGSAMHKLIFEGKAAFDALYVGGPDQTGLPSAQKAVSTKAANAAAAATGRTSLKFDKYARCLMAGAMVTKNPHLAKVFSGGHAEVSFIWEQVIDGVTVRLKARFDYLKCTQRKFGMVVGNGDLKTVGNPYENDFPTECYASIARYRYDAQAAHYMDGLKIVPAAIRSGAWFNHDGRDLNEEWLERFLAPDLHFGWQWIFVQTTGAPITHSMSVSPENPILDAGRHVIHMGIENYVRCMKEFGPDKMWILVEEPHEAMVESMPGWFGR